MLYKQRMQEGWGKEVGKWGGDVGALLASAQEAQPVRHMVKLVKGRACPRAEANCTSGAPACSLTVRSGTARYLISVVCCREALRES